MESNLKVRLFENANIGGTHYKKALGFTYRLSTDFKRELFVVPFPKTEDDPGISMRYGNGHIRLSVKDDFKKFLGTDDPRFSALWDYYGAQPGAIKEKDFIFRCC